MARTIRERLDAIAADPYGPHPYAKAFGGGAFRLRVGDWRVLYELHDDRLVVVVVRTAHRREVYR